MKTRSIWVKTGGSLLLLSLVILGMVLPVSAIDLTFVDRSPVLNQEFIVHEIHPGENSSDPVAVSVVGRLNSTTDRLTLDPNSSYVLELYTSRTDYIKSPNLMLTDGSDALLDNWKFLIVLAVLLGIFAVAYRSGKR